MLRVDSPFIYKIYTIRGQRNRLNGATSTRSVDMQRLLQEIFSAGAPSTATCSSRYIQQQFNKRKKEKVQFISTASYIRCQLCLCRESNIISQNIYTV